MYGSSISTINIMVSSMFSIFQWISHKCPKQWHNFPWRMFLFLWWNYCLGKYIQTHSTSIHKWNSFPNASISYNSVLVILIFILFVLSTENKVLANSVVFQECLIHTDLQDVPQFDTLILSNTFLCIFLLVFCFGWLHLLSRFLLFSSTRQVRTDLFLYFQIKCSSIL